MKQMIILIFVIFIGACSYSVHSNSYPHLKTIVILPFTNNTTEYNLEEDLLNELSNLFINDGRLKIVGISPDCQLEGEILDYTDKIYTYDSSTIDAYQVKILFKIIFTDLKKNSIIWQNNSLILSETYSETDESSEFSSEAEAQNEIMKDLYDTIIKNSLEEW